MQKKFHSIEKMEFIDDLFDTGTSRRLADIKAKEREHQTNMLGRDYIEKMAQVE